MRLTATALLAAMAILFIVATALQTRAPWMAFPRAFFEAGVVGGVADWFAVVALFRHPFGIPIPHTALIPRQKDRIAEAIGQFVVLDLLDIGELTLRIERLDPGALLADWLLNPRGADDLDAWRRPLALTLDAILEDEAFLRLSRRLIEEGLDAVEAAPLLSRLLTAVLEQERYDAAFNVVAEASRSFLSLHQQDIRNKIARTGVRWVPRWVDGRVADAVIAELISVLGAAREQASHPWRTQGRRAIERLIARLASDSELANRCEAIKGELLGQRFAADSVTWSAGALKGWVRSAVGEISDQTAASAYQLVLEAIGRRIESDAALRESVNLGVRQVILRALAGSRAQIGRFVTEVVSRWDTPTLVNRLELQVGKDLQYIRLNGTLVGGTVGLLIYGVTRLLS